MNFLCVLSLSFLISIPIVLPPLRYTLIYWFCVPEAVEANPTRLAKLVDVVLKDNVHVPLVLSVKKSRSSVMSKPLALLPSKVFSSFTR